MPFATCATVFTSRGHFIAPACDCSTEIVSLLTPRNMRDAIVCVLGRSFTWNQLSPPTEVAGDVRHGFGSHEAVVVLYWRTSDR